MNALNIEIFSDLICPWCYIGRRRLEAGLNRLGANELPHIIWRPFELNPDLPKAGLDRKAYRSAKFGSWERSQAMDREVAEIGRTLGLEFNYGRVFKNAQYAGGSSSALVGERQRLARRFGGRPLPSLLHGRSRHREK
jgi:predicted DsbA family dithiol-disulfide isomerase